MAKVDYESYLFDHLAESYGRQCINCENTSGLQVYHFWGQERLEKEFFDSDEEMYGYYLAFYDEESNYLGLICKDCKPIRTPDRPTLEETEMIVKELIEKELFEEVTEFIKKYPHTAPIIGRIQRENLCDEGGRCGV